MKKIKEEEMKKINGGSSAMTTAINTVLKAINILYEIGQHVGSGIRRAKGNNYCSLK